MKYRRIPLAKATLVSRRQERDIQVETPRRGRIQRWRAIQTTRKMMKRVRSFMRQNPFLLR